MKCPKCKADNFVENQTCNRCGAPLTKIPKAVAPKEAKLPKFAYGEKFGKRYQIIEEISRGKMGRVYKAMDNKLNKVVSLRILNSELSAEPWPVIVERLKKESLLAKDVTAESITKLYEIWKVGKIAFISTQYVEGQGVSKPAKLSRKLLVSFSVALIVLVGLLIFFAIRKMKPESPLVIEPGKKSIAVMYFENNTGDESLNHWRKALSDLLITDLSQSKYLRVLTEDKLFNILSQLNQLETREYPLEVLQQVAEKGKVGYILLGSYSRAGEFFRINIKIQEAKTGELIASEMVEAWGEAGVFAMVDELSRRIKANFELTEEQLACDIDKEVGKITTSSPEAYKYYCEGRKFQAKGDCRQAIKLMDRAVAIDPKFAIAYISIASNYYNLGYEPEYKKYIQKGLSLVDRVSERERYLIQGNVFFQSEKTWEKAIEAYKKLLQLYPDDLIGNNNLGALYLELEQFDKAIERYEICINNYESYIPYNNLALIYMAMGLYNKAREALENYLSNFSDNAAAYRCLASNNICQAKYDIAMVEADKAILLNPDYFENLMVKGDIYHLRGDLIEAEKEYQKLLKSKEPIAHLEGLRKLGHLYLLQGAFDKSESQFKKGIKEAKKLGGEQWVLIFRSFLAYLYLKSGHPDEAMQECNRMWNSSVEREELFFQKLALYFKGLSYIELNLMDKATETAKELRKLIEEGLDRKKINHYYHLIGMMELKRSNFPQAIEYFEKAISLLPSQYTDVDCHAFLIGSLAKAYYQLGDLERAREEYENIVSLTMGRLIYGDIYAKSYYMLGKIYQQKDWKGKAIENYERFLDLCKDSAPPIPELMDAKKQLEALKSSNNFLPKLAHFSNHNHPTF